MPTYQALCAKCNTHHDFFRKIDERDDTPVCCGEKTDRVLVAPMLQAVTITQAIVGGDGNTYYGRNEYDRYLKKNGLVVHSEMKGEAEYQRKEAQKAHKAEIRRDIEDVVRSTL